MASVLFTLLFAAVPLFAAPSGPPELRGRDVVTGKEIHVKPGGGPLVIVFLSAVCPCSDSHRPELAQLKTDFPQATIVGVNANADEDLPSAKEYFTRAALPFPVIRDPRSVLTDRLKALRTPHAFLFTADGRLVFQGGVSDTSQFSASAKKYLREALEDVTAGRPVRTAQARPLGCVITRGD